MDDRIFKLLANNIPRTPLGATEVADLLWFATQLRLRETRSQFPPALETPTQPDSPTQTASNTTTETENKDEESTSDSQSTESSSTSEPTAPLTTAQPTTSSRRSGLPFAVPAARAIPNPRAIARALRSLHRKVPARTRQMIDVAATIERVAEERVLMPVLKAAPERWLDVALVVERAGSYGIWQQTIAEFEQILVQQGAFRDVRRWTAEPSGGKLRLLSRQGTRRDPRELIQLGHQRLILILSDCVDVTWTNGAWWRWCRVWGQHHMVAIVQMLPPSFWRRSRLQHFEPLWLSSQRVGPLNGQWQVEREDEEELAGFVLPVVTLQPYALQVWARGLVGQSPAQVRGYALTPVEVPTTPSTVRPPQPSARQRFERFMATASAPARRLAALMSAVPVQLPIVRLIQRVMCGSEASAIHVAEVFLGGILERQGREDDPEKQLYAFRADGEDDIRVLLNGVLPRVEIASVIDCLSADIMRRAGLSLKEFRAMLMMPEKASTEELVAEVGEFARVTLTVLRQLGGEYKAFAEQLSASNPETIPGAVERGEDGQSTKQKPPQVENIESVVFTFEVATIEQRSVSQDQTLTESWQVDHISYG